MTPLPTCDFCGAEFEKDRLGKYGCPNCNGEGLELDGPPPRGLVELATAEQSTPETAGSIFDPLAFQQRAPSRMTLAAAGAAFALAARPGKYRRHSNAERNTYCPCGKRSPEGRRLKGKECCYAG